ncbi:hypothetical protein GGH92_010252, partial [Coemansia sp. RSA 2673]
MLRSQSTLSTPRSSNSEGYYQNLRTVSDLPDKLEDIAESTSGSSQQGPPTGTTLHIQASKGSHGSSHAISVALMASPNEFDVSDKDVDTTGRRHSSTLNAATQQSEQANRPLVSNAMYTATDRQRAADARSLHHEFGRDSGDYIGAHGSAGGDSSAGIIERRANRPASLTIASHDEAAAEVSLNSADTPPSPLIQVDDPLLAKSLRFAASPKSEGDSVPLLASLAHGLDQPASAPMTKRADSSLAPQALEAAVVTTTPTHSLTRTSAAAVAPLVCEENVSALPNAQHASPHSPAHASSTAANTTTNSPKVDTTPELPGSDGDASAGRVVSKTRLRIRDKMALFNRAKQKAKSKLLGISERLVDDDAEKATDRQSRSLLDALPVANEDKADIV